MVGTVEPIDIIVNRETGKFGTLAQHEDAKISQWSSMDEAEAHVRRINAEGATDAIIVESGYDSGGKPKFMTITKVRVRQVQGHWAFTSGEWVNYKMLYIASPEILAEIEAKRVEFERLYDQMMAVRDEAWDLVKGLEKLNGPGKL